MLKKAVVGMAQWLPASGVPDENLETACRYIQQLAAARCDLILLPELWPSGFDWATLGSDVKKAAEPIDGTRTRVLAGAARSAGSWLLAGSVPELADRVVFNTALLFSRDGSLVATHRKCHLYAPLGEDQVVAAGHRITTRDTDDFGTVGVSICFDGDFPEMARAMKLAGARVILNPSAYEIAAERWWDVLYPANALANGQWWLMPNQCGTNSAGTLLGASQVISPMGEVVSSAPRAAEGETPDPVLLVAEIDLAAQLELAEASDAALWQLRRSDLYEREAQGI